MDNQKSFFERMGDLLNTPLPGTEATHTPTPSPKSDTIDDSLLSRIKDILNTPLPGSNDFSSTEEILPEINSSDLQENWWDTDWAAFKAHQEQDRKGLNVKQRQDQEGFAHYQEQERYHFEIYQAQEFEIFQRQQQAKVNWIQNQQLSQAAGVQVAGIVPPPPPIQPLAPEMPNPPWMKT